MDFKTFACAELNRIGWIYRVERKDIMIRCPNHASNKLNCAIHTRTKVTPGSVHCWVCGKNYSGHWNNILVRDLNVKPYDEKYIDGDTILASADSMINDIKEMNAAYEPVKNLMPWTGTWRGLTEDFLKYNNAYLYRDYKREKNWIHFKVTEGNKLLGHVNVRLDLDIKPNNICPWSIHNDWINAKRDCLNFNNNSGSCYNCNNKKCISGAQAVTFPKSLNSSGDLSLKALFPLIDVVDTAILVEGIFSSLRFRNLGIPAYANLGVECYSQYKSTILHALGVKKLILCFDGDTPGYEHARSIYSGIKKDGKKIVNGIKDEFQATIVDFPSGYDPGDIPEEKLGPLLDIIHSDKHISYLKLE